MKTLRRRLVDYVKTLCQKTCRTCSTIIFFRSANQIFDLLRCRWRCRRQILNNLILTLEKQRTIFDKGKGDFHISLYKVLHSVSKSKKRQNSHAWRPCSAPFFAMRPMRLCRVHRPYNQCLTLSRDRKKQTHKIFDWHMHFGVWFLTQKFFPKRFLRSRSEFDPVTLFISIIWLRLAVFAEPHQTLVAFLNSFILKV